MTTRPRDQRGDSGPGLISSLIVIIALIAVFKVVFDIDLLTYFEATVHWAEDLVRAIGAKF